MSQAEFFSLTAFSAEAIAAGESADSAVYNTNDYRLTGDFSGQLLVAGSGNVDIDLYVSNNGGTSFVKYATLFSGQAAGEVLEGFMAPICEQFYFKAVEKSTTDAATVSLWVGSR